MTPLAPTPPRAARRPLAWVALALSLTACDRPAAPATAPGAPPGAAPAQGAAVPSAPAEPGTPAAPGAPAAPGTLAALAEALGPEARAMLAPERATELPPATLVAALALRPTDTVADIGAGPGFLTEALARAVPKGRVVATDLDAAALAYTARRCADAGLTNVETRAATATEPGLAPASLDVAVLLQVDHQLADAPGYLGRVRAALKPGGRLALVNFEGYRTAALAAAATAGFTPLSETKPSRRHFAALLVPAPAGAVPAAGSDAALDSDSDAAPAHRPKPAPAAPAHAPPR